jgi:predicted molibdopterin-dependent oxidoreductase YjgC
MFRRLHDPAPAVTLTIDGTPVQAEPGETVAAVLLRTPPFHARTTMLSGARRAPYCMMGVCFDCLAVVDGERSVQTCLTLVRDGMTVERQGKDLGRDWGGMA